MVIDYVVPMVFHDDLEWRGNFARVGVRYDEHCLASFVRYRSWNTEHLLIRCVKKFMPFVRTIYILLAQESQKRFWMDEEGVRVVYHREFIPERFLPTFNSQSMEMFLKNIPGLSEYFIYGNDDMFPIAPLREKDFFVNGLPCLHHREAPFPSRPNVFHLGCHRGLNFVAEEFGKTFWDTWLKGGHSLTPMLKSTWEHLWERGDEIEASVSPFRETKNFNQYICPWWHHLSKKYIDRTPRTIYVNTKKRIGEVCDAFRCGDYDVVCVNDNECVSDYMAYGRAVIECLEEKLKD